MTAFAGFWNILMSICVFGGIAASLVLVYSLIFLRDDTFARGIGRFVNKHILWIGLALSLASIIASLTYSEIIGFPPCLLCWWARVFFYPQFILYAIALKKKDFGVLKYSYVLSLLGLCVSTYHYVIETVGYSPLPCEVGGVSCLSRYVYEFGFITIPLMGLVGFLVLALSLLLARKYQNKVVT